MDRIDEFLTYLKIVKGQREGTINTNRKLITKLLRDLPLFNASATAMFINSCIQEKKSPSYIKQIVTVIRQWGECFSIQELASFPYPKITYISAFTRATFSDKEIHDFLALPNPYRKTHKRKCTYKDRYDMWQIFYTILFYHGLRTIEIARLTVDMFDFGLNIINLSSEITKTGEFRVVPISPSVREKLYNYVNSLQGDYLFPALHESAKERGLHVQQNDWNLHFKRQLERLGIKRKNLTPYSGRHTYGTRQAEEDVHLSKIKAIMGHKRITTTEGYIHLGIKSLRAVQENDRLRRYDLSYNKRIVLARAKVREILETFAKTPKEEKKMLKELLNLP